MRNDDYFRGLNILLVGNSSNGRFTGNLNRSYVVLPLILKAATPVGAARANGIGLPLALAISQSVVERTAIRCDLPVPTSPLILIRSREGPRPT